MRDPGPTPGTAPVRAPLLARFGGDGRCAWHNAAFAEAFGEAELAGRGLAQLGLPESWLEAEGPLEDPGLEGWHPGRWSAEREDGELLLLFSPGGPEDWIEQNMGRIWGGNQPVAYHVLDAEGRLVSANDAFFKLLGRPREEMDKLGLEELGGSAEWLQAALSRAEGCAEDLAWKRGDGSPLAVRATTAAIPTHAGLRLFCWTRDLGESGQAARLAQERADQYRALAEGILALSLCGSEEELFQVLLARARTIFPCLHWALGQLVDGPQGQQLFALQAWTPTVHALVGDVLHGLKLPILATDFSRRIYFQQRTTLVEDCPNHPEAFDAEVTARFRLQSLLGVPVGLGGQLLGVIYALAFLGEAPLAPTELQREGLENLTRVAALALNRLRTQSALEAGLEQASQLNEHLRAFQSALSEVAAQRDLGQVMQMLLEVVRESSGVERWAVYGVAEGGSALKILGHTGFQQEFDTEGRVPIGGPDSGVSGWAAALGEPVLVEDLDTHAPSQSHRDWIRAEGLRSAIATPLKGRRGELLGVMTGYGTEPGRPPEPVRSQLGLFSALATLAIERFVLWDHLQQELRQRRESEALYRALVEESLSGVYMIQDGVFIYTNPAFCDIFGYSEEELRGMPVGNLVSDQDRDQVVANVRKRVTGEMKAIHYSFQAQGKGRRNFPVEVHGSAVRYGGRPAVLGVLIDITERLRAQELGADASRRAESLASASLELAQAEDEDTLLLILLHWATRLAPFGTWWFARPDAEGASVATHWTPGLERLSEPWDIRRPVPVEPGSWLEELYGFRQQVLIPRFAADARAPREVAGLAPVSLAGFPLLAGMDCLGALVGASFSGEPTALDEVQEKGLMSLAGSAALALQRLRTVEALTASELRFRQLFDQSVEAILIGDMEQGYVMANPAAERLLGRPLMEILGCRPGSFSPEFQPDGDRSEELAAQYAAEASAGQALQFEWVHLRPDGGEVITDIHLFPIWDGDRQRLQMIVRDVTEARRVAAEKQLLERQLYQAQKMESLGILAGGIAHDFNNLLTGMLGHADLGLSGMAGDHPLHRHLDAIRRTAMRASELTRQLLAYSGKGTFVLRHLDLTGQVEELAHLLEVSIPKAVSLKLDLDRQLPAMEADSAQIQQVIMNLVINAAEAMEGTEGTIRLSTGQEQLEREDLHELHGGELEPGAYLFLRVADNGCGMDEETLARIFEPFFTTKFTGRGLGLSAILGIVRGHGGALRIRSRRGEGSVFTVYFPASQTQPPRKEEKPAEEKHAARGSGLILVVDDDEMVRNVARQALEMRGYRVLEAGDGVEALEHLRSRGQHVSLVLLDATMPNLSGEATLRELRVLFPQLPVLLSSGYAEGETLERFPGLTAGSFLPKPYGPRDLLSKVQALLAEG